MLNILQHSYGWYIHKPKLLHSNYVVIAAQSNNSIVHHLPTTNLVHVNDSTAYTSIYGKCKML